MFQRTMELHESRCAGLKEAGNLWRNIALTVANESDSDTSLDEDQEAYLVRKKNKHFKVNNFDRKQASKLLKKKQKEKK